MEQGTVYSHFGSKECLYEAMLKRCRDRLPPLPRLGDGDLQNRLEHAAGVLLRLARHPATRCLRQLLGTTPAGRERLGAILSTHLDAWRHELERAFENAPYCKDPVLATSIFIHLLIDAPTLTALLHSTAAPSDRKLIATLVAPLVGRPSPEDHCHCIDP